jgi:hypothetical protein
MHIQGATTQPALTENSRTSPTPKWSVFLLVEGACFKALFNGVAGNGVCGRGVRATNGKAGSGVSG